MDVLRIGNVPSYFELDSRIGWRPNDVIDFALVGRNLLDSSHLEFADDDEVGTRATEVQRELFGVITLRY